MELYMNRFGTSALGLLAALALPHLALAEPDLVASTQIQSLCVSASYGKTTTQPAPHFAQYPLKTIVLDPGHGGDNEGAKGVTGRMEKDLTLQVANAVEAKLKMKRPDLRIVLTRRADVNPDLSSRIEVANSMQADLFVSIHFNASLNLEAYGFESFWAGDFHEAQSTSDGDSAQTRLIKHMAAPFAQRMASAFNQAMAKRFDTLDRGVKPGDYTVLTKATVPAVVLELAFLSNAREGKQVARKHMQRKYVDAIVTAILDYEKQLQDLDETMLQALDINAEYCKI